MHVGLAELDLETNELGAATAHLDASSALGDALGLPQNAYRWRVAMAGVRAAEGDVEGALDLVDEAERVYTADFFPAVRPIASLRARLWTMLGRRADALAWAAERHLSADDPLAYVTEYEHITLAQALLAGAVADGNRGDVESAAALIDRLLAAASAGGRIRGVIELTAMRSVACATARDREGAEESIEAALALAEPEGFVRLLADLGPAIAPLVREAVRRADVALVRGASNRAGQPYGRRLLAVLDEPTPPRPQPLIEPLSDRELEVLRLLATDLDGPAIASRLFVSLNTMRTHTKNIFAKLGVNSRGAAVARAAELGLLARAH